MLVLLETIDFFQNYLNGSHLLHIQITNTILSIKAPHGYELSLQTCPISLLTGFYLFSIPNTSIYSLQGIHSIK